MTTEASPPTVAARLAKLTEPFTSDEVGLLPRITCKACSDDRGKACPKHAKRDCKGCGQWMTPSHIHLDFVGHADVTKRLLDVDPEWTWEPVADPAALGFPVVQGGMWIRLTVCGVSRYGFGDAQGKTGPNAVKELIGDALRNAAMRFGVALNLWAKGDRDWSRQGGAAADAEHAAEGPKPIGRQPGAPAPDAEDQVAEDLWAAQEHQLLADAEGYAELVDQAKEREDVLALWGEAKAKGLLTVRLAKSRGDIPLGDYMTAVGKRLAEAVPA